jgi:hypothetical protein
VEFGTIAPMYVQAATAYNLICMAYPDGREPARYRRTHPNGPWIYTGGTAWEFQYVPGNEFPVFDTVHGKVGLAMCSEVYMPEVARALAFAPELIFVPAARTRDAMGDLAHADLGPRDQIWRWSSPDCSSCRARALGGGAEEILFESRRAPASLMWSRSRTVPALTSRRGRLVGHCAANGPARTQWQRPEPRLESIRPLREAPICLLR